MADHPGSGGRPARATSRPARRRQGIRTDTTRSVLGVVVAEFLLPTGEAAWTSTFLEILGRFGIRPGTARQALARAAADDEQGLLCSDAVGRRKLWRLTSAGEALLRDTTARAFGFAQQPEEWDGRWLVVLASIPEDDRSSRYLLRSRLIWAGLGSPAPGVWVGTHTARQAEVDEALASAGISDQARVFVARHQHIDQMTSMVADAWDLESIARDYEQFMEDFPTRRTGEPLMQLVRLVVAWTRVVLQDPGLPPELLPATWPRAEAAAVFLDRHERWRPAAVERWHEINDGGRPAVRTPTR
jgi:phenylacetic acid degradation operon negative regulatory protein